MKVTSRPLDAASFERIVAAHEAFASGRPGGARAIPRLVVAPNMVCNQRLLADVDFTGADLSRGAFIGADFSRAALYCANLSRCDFRRARLIRADLRGATLAGAKLAGADLQAADMRAAILCAVDDLAGLKWLGGAADATGARMDDADLSQAVAHGVDFSNCSLRGAKLRMANLKHATFTNADLHGADLSGAKLEGAQFVGAIMTGIDLSALGLGRSTLKDCVVEPSPQAVAALPILLQEIAQARRWVETGGREGRPAQLDDMDLRPAERAFAGQPLVAMSARRALCVQSDFSGALLQGANFEGADLRGANFTGADLRGAIFRNAKLNHAQFRDADLRPLALRQGGRRAVDLSGAILDGTGLRWSAPPPSPPLPGAIEGQTSQN